MAMPCVEREFAMEASSEKQQLLRGQVSRPLSYLTLEYSSCSIVSDLDNNDYY